MFSRFISDYGIIFVLFALCAVFSVATLDEQHPTGEAAGRELATEIVRETQPGATIFIAVRNTQEDADFAAALTKALEAQGREVRGALQGEPSDIRSALEETQKKGLRVDAIASVQAAGFGALLERMKSDYPQMAQMRLFIPTSYLWPHFLKATNLLNITNQIVLIAITAIGMSMVIITGGIDLSVGSILALSAVVTAVLIRDVMGGYEASGAGLFLASLAAIGMCGLIGSLTGTLITAFSIPPFIVTLSMMLIASGLALKLSNSESINDIPNSFQWLGAGADIGNIPNAVVLMLVLYVLAHVVMSRTVLGRYIYAVGGNTEAARLSGVPTVRIIILVYVLTGIFAGLGGVILASQLKSSNPNYGFMHELYVIAAVVVGGTSLSGGEGKMFATLIGAFIIAVIQNGMNLTGIKSDNQRIVLGLVILVAVLVDKWKRSGWETFVKMRKLFARNGNRGLA
jgi:ribose transport system permease protein